MASCHQAGEESTFAMYPEKLSQLKQGTEGRDNSRSQFEANSRSQHAQGFLFLLNMRRVVATLQRLEDKQRKTTDKTQMSHQS